MIYQLPGIGEPIDQGDIIEGCPTLSLTGYDVAGLHPPQINAALSRVLVLTQTCDFANQKAMLINLAVLLDAQVLADPGVLKKNDIRGPIRAGRVFGWYFLPRSEDLGLPEMIVDLRQLHSVELELLTPLCERGQRRAAPLPLSRTSGQAPRRYLQPHRAPGAL